MQADLQRAAAVLRAGGIVVYPTDTVWGLGCDARRGEAVRRIFQIKRRADAKAMICLVPDLESLRQVVGEIPDEALEMIGGDRPTTVVYPRAAGLASELLSADGSAGLRVTREAFSSQLCRLLGAPLVSTSANLSGRPAARCYGEIAPEILGQADYVCRSRRDEAPHSRPSRVVKIGADGSVAVLRD